MEKKQKDIYYYSTLSILSILLILPMAAPTHAAPVRKAYVTDLTGTLGAKDIAEINNHLRLFHQLHGPEIAVLLIPSTRGESIEKYSLRTARAWKLGDSRRNDGVLLLIAKRDRKLRIEVGTGLSTRLSDARAAKIIRTDITPLFKKGRIKEGIKRGLHGMRAVLRPGALEDYYSAVPPEVWKHFAPPAKSSPRSASQAPGLVGLVVVLGLAVLTPLLLVILLGGVHHRGRAKDQGKSANGGFWAWFLMPNQGTTSPGNTSASSSASSTPNAATQAVLAGTINSSISTTISSGISSGSFSGGGGSFSGGGSTGSW